jgi:uncharacterized protein
MPAIIDLKQAPPMTTVAHDVVTAVGPRSAGFLSRDRRQQLRIDAVARSRARNVPGERHAEPSEVAGAAGLFLNAEHRLYSQSDVQMLSHHAGDAFDKGLSEGYDERSADGLVNCRCAEIDAERGLPRGASVYVMGSSSLIDVASLSGSGQYLAIEEQVKLDPFEGKTFVAPARAELRVQRAGRALEINGSITVQGQGDCDRCLTEVGFPVVLAVNERIEATAVSGTDPFDESNVLAGDRLDVADLTQQLVCGAVPLRLLCSEECKGLCRACGANLNIESCACTGEIGNG